MSEISNTEQIYSPDEIRAMQANLAERQELTFERIQAARPCAVMRGVIGHWRIDDLVLGRSLAFASGAYEDARVVLRAKADELGYYLSAWSDADDRMDG